MVRFVPKRFAQNSNHSGVFGSFQAQGGNVGDGTLSNDPDTLQGGSAWPLGWSAATNSFLQIPRGEEVEAVERVTSAAIVQQFIDGITFWQPEMPVIQYQTIVQYQTGSDLPKLYVNITGMNTATPPDNDEVNWQIFSLGGSGRNVGDIFYTSRLDTSLNGAVECNGEQYNVADFTGPQAVPALLTDGLLPSVSMAEYESIVSANGSCRCFGWDGADAAVFKVPKLNDVYLMAGTAASADEFISESLPNVAVNTGANVKIATSGAAGASSGAGALFFQNHSVTTGATMGGATTVGYDTLYLDMSRSNTVFKNGAKVRPDSVRYRAMVQIATGATDAALETCSGVIADVAGLKDASNFTTTGKSTISGLGFLDTTKFENNIVNMTVTTVKQTFVAPANGHIYIVNESSTPIAIYGTNCGSIRIGQSAGAIRQGSVTIQKGGIAYINTQEGTATLTQATFYYAKGEV